MWSYMGGYDPQRAQKGTHTREGVQGRHEPREMVTKSLDSQKSI